MLCCENNETSISTRWGSSSTRACSSLITFQVKYWEYHCSVIHSTGKLNKEKIIMMNTLLKDFIRPLFSFDIFDDEVQFEENVMKQKVKVGVFHFFYRRFNFNINYHIQCGSLLQRTEYCFSIKYLLKNSSTAYATG